MSRTKTCAYHVRWYRGSTKKRGTSSIMPRVRPPTWIFSVKSALLLGRRGVAVSLKGHAPWTSGGCLVVVEEIAAAEYRVLVGGASRTSISEMSTIGLAVLANWSALRALPVGLMDLAIEQDDHDAAVGEGGRCCSLVPSSFGCSLLGISLVSRGRVSFISSFCCCSLCVAADCLDHVFSTRSGCGYS